MEVLIWGTGNMARIHSARLARRTDVTITAVISRRGGGETLPGAAGGRILSGPEELETLPRRPDLAVRDRLWDDKASVSQGQQTRS